MSCRFNIISMTLVCMFIAQRGVAELEPASVFGDEDLSSAVAPQVAIPVQIFLKPQVIIEKPFIYLGDIASCEGLPSVCEEFEGVEIFNAPTPGSEMALSKEKITGILQAEFPDYIILVKNSENVQVKSEVKEVDDYAIEKRLQDKLDSLFSQAEDLRARVTFFKLNQKVQVRPGEFEVVFPFLEEIQSLNIMNLPKEFVTHSLIDISLRSKANIQENFIFKAQIRILTENYIPVAVRPIASGETIHVNDFHYQWQKIKRHQNSVIKDVAPYEGWIVRRALNEGDSLSVSVIEKKKIITRGQIVEMNLIRGAMSIMAKGKSMDDAAEGDMLRVYYSDTKRTLSGRAVTKDRVEVRL